MKEFKVTYTQLRQQVLFMIIFPAVFILLLIYGLVPFPNLPDWTVFTLIFAGMALMIVIFLWVFYRYLLVDARIVVAEKTIGIQLLKRTPFYFAGHFETNYSNVKNAALDYDVQAGKTFIQLQLRKPSANIILSTRKDVDDSVIEELWEELESNINIYNEQHASEPSMLIAHNSFWNGPWVKLIAHASMIGAIIITYVKIRNPESIESWRLIAYYCYALPLWLAVLSASKK